MVEIDDAPSFGNGPMLGARVRGGSVFAIRGSPPSSAACNQNPSSLVAASARHVTGAPYRDLC